MTWRDIASTFVKEREACELHAYPDPGSADGTPWTIGYGYTRGVKKGDVWSQELADAKLIEALHEADRHLQIVVDPKHQHMLNDHQYAALVSFVYNVGAGKDWTIWKRIAAEDFAEVPTQMRRFVFNDGKKMKGLVNRREAEIKLWLGDKS